MSTFASHGLTLITTWHHFLVDSHLVSVVVLHYHHSLRLSRCSRRVDECGKVVLAQFILTSFQFCAKEFEKQVKEHAAAIKKHFGVKPTAFRNTELIYSDAIGAAVADMGYNVMLTEGAKHILGWKSPNFVYTNSINPKLKLLLKNFNLSDDIAFRFSDKGSANWPLTSDKYAGWLQQAVNDSEIVNLFMDYETFGEHQSEATAA